MTPQRVNHLVIQLCCKLNISNKSDFSKHLNMSAEKRKKNLILRCVGAIVVLKIVTQKMRIVNHDTLRFHLSRNL